MCLRAVHLQVPLHHHNHPPSFFFRLVQLIYALLKLINCVGCKWRGHRKLHRSLQIYTAVCKVLHKKALGFFVHCLGEWTGLPRVREKSGKNTIFSRSGNCQGILKKCQGILAIWPMSGKCQGILSWQLIFFLNMVGIYLLAYIFKS